MTPTSINLRPTRRYVSFACIPHKSSHVPILVTRVGVPTTATQYGMVLNSMKATSCHVNSSGTGFSYVNQKFRRNTELSVKWVVTIDVLVPLKVVLEMGAVDSWSEVQAA